jgi:hypothetical protein
MLRVIIVAPPSQGEVKLSPGLILEKKTKAYKPDPVSPSSVTRAERAAQLNRALGFGH